MTLAADQNPKQLFPDDVFEGASPDIPWRVAHTKSRREKALAAFLSEHHIGYYLPLIKRRQPSRLRTRYAMVPLFPGYIFFKGTAEHRYTAFTSNHISKIIEVVNQEQFIAELTNTYKLLSLNSNVYPYDFLTEGEKVRVTQGPMKGVEGIISYKKGNCRLVVNVTTISHSVAVDVEAGMVEKVS